MGQEGVLSPAPGRLLLICSLVLGRACLLLIQILPITRAQSAEKSGVSRDCRVYQKSGHTSIPTGLKQNLDVFPGVSLGLVEVHQSCMAGLSEA